jgi:hypothetical protein
MNGQQSLNRCHNLQRDDVHAQNQQQHDGNQNNRSYDSLEKVQSV